MTEESTRVVRIERTFEAPAEEVFDAWTSEEVLRRWFHAGPDWETPSAEVDLRVGGTVRIVMRSPDGTEVEAWGEYTLIERPHKLAFTWTFDDDPSNQQLIELELTEQDGVTTVMFVNSEISPEERRDRQEYGWGLCFDELDRALTA
jgi:uncharacterized protein YndB with AHSA1/START domain